MKLLILQLSDIHIKGKKDRVFMRDKYIVEAIRNLTNHIDLCIVTVTGDTAFSGSIEQYSDSLEIFETLKKELPQALNGAPVEFVIIPGNHDCDFTLESRVRSSVLHMVKQDGIVDQSVITSATSVQDDFFRLQKLYFNKNLEINNRLYWQYSFEHDNTNILFACFNTAWLSELREKPSTMYYPLEYMPDPHGIDLVVSLFHHPYNWLQPDNGREFRKKIESISDIILTGHEHDATARTVRIGGQQESTHIEAGALQDSYNPTTSEFNCIIVDTKEYTRAILPFKWENNRYRSIYPIDARWETYHKNSRRTENEFGLTESTNTWLNDLGLQVKHPQRGRLSHSDIFIFPDLLDMGLWQRTSPRIIGAEKFYEQLAQTNKVIITGISESGKTSLSKELFRHYYEEGLIPIYLDGSENRTFSADSRMVVLLGRECEETYNNLNSEDYRQLDKSRRVLIIDNLDKVSFKSGKRSAREVLDFLTSFSGILILLANDVALQTTEAISEDIALLAEADTAMNQLKIQPFGHVLREQLVEKWFSFDDQTDVEGDIYKKIHEVKGLLDTVIGNNFLPPYPVILLPLLQAHQYNDTVNTHASTYGYFYELLILRSLAEKSSRVPIDIKKGYLTFLAKYLFDREVTKLTEDETLEFHQAYQAKFEIRISYRDIIVTLKDNNILADDNGDISFKYKYIYYYYIASNLRDTLSEDETRKIIIELTASIHKDLSANILLFLTHLTKDSFIVNQMISAASKVFPDASAANLLEDVSFLSDMKGIQENIFRDQDVHDSRKQRNLYLDKIEESSGEGITTQLDNEIANYVQHSDIESENPALTQEQEDFVERVGVAMKTLQILGQLLKNFVGTMDGNTKNRLVNECVGIGLRALGSVLISIEPSREDMIRSIASIFKEEDPTLTIYAATNKAIHSIFGIIHNNAYGAVVRISNAIGSPLLTQAYDRLVEQNDSPAVRLIYTALYFDQAQSFPLAVLKDSYEKTKSHPMALSVLKSLTFNQFYTFNIPPKTKQIACSTLQVQYTPLIGANKNTKLLKGK